MFLQSFITFLNIIALYIFVSRGECELLEIIIHYCLALSVSIFGFQLQKVKSKEHEPGRGIRWFSPQSGVALWYGLAEGLGMTPPREHSFWGVGSCFRKQRLFINTTLKIWN